MLLVLTIVLSILVALLLALSFALLSATKRLRAQVAATSKQLDRLERALHAQEARVARLDAKVSARPEGLAGSVIPLLQTAAGYRSQGIVPTILMIGWRLLSGYLGRKESARSLANR